MDIKEETNSIVTAVDLNTPLTLMERSSRWKNHKETATLNEPLDNIDLIDFFKSHPKA